MSISATRDTPVPVLAIMAHADDAELWAGGTLALHARDGPVRATVIINITATYDIKMRALAAHSRTQPISAHFGPMAETLARLWGARIGARYAEAYTPIPVLGRLPAALHL
jgi:LmbE family N-acetylglucosaminyl deacetylase